MNKLGMFSFVEQVLEELDYMKVDLDIASREIEYFFESILKGQNEGYINVNSRVKSSHSLKEKVLRHDYFAEYGTAEAMFQNLSDLIGIRLECRFIADEIAIYKILKEVFELPSTEYAGYFTCSSNPMLALELESKQPKGQKNGIKMYRIDGKYQFGERIINFEVQIKSLVNIFWSEIEHKVIYKNYNYIIVDRFYKDIMSSIKNSLTTIDQQLLLISNQFDRGNVNTAVGRKNQLEKLLSKIMYDAFALKIKNSIGIMVDFRKSCDTIVKYVFRDVLYEDEEGYNRTLVKALERLNDIEDKKIEFTTPITFKRDCKFEDAFGDILTTFIKEVINEEFQWNVFFRILFEVEPDCNAGDLENFVNFYRKRIEEGIDREKLQRKLQRKLAPNEIDEVIEVLLERYATLFAKVNTVELFYDGMIEQIISMLNNIIDTISRNIANFHEWNNEREIYLQLFELRLLSILDIEVEATKVLDFLDDVRKSDSNIEIHKSILKNIDKL